MARFAPFNVVAFTTFGYDEGNPDSIGLTRVETYTKKNTLIDIDRIVEIVSLKDNFKEASMFRRQQEQDQPFSSEPLHDKILKALKDAGAQSVLLRLRGDLSDNYEPIIVTDSIEDLTEIL